MKGDGKALRSYLYADDLVIWLFNLLEYGCAGKAYNVGSDHALSIAELAHQVADILAPGLPVKILGESGGGAVPQPYVPDISASREAGLSCEETTFSDAVKLSAVPR